MPAANGHLLRGLAGRAAAAMMVATVVVGASAAFGNPATAPSDGTGPGLAANRPAQAQGAETGPARGDTAPQPPVPLTVATYNIQEGFPCVPDGANGCRRGPHIDLVTIADAIAHLDADVVALQEIRQLHPAFACEDQPQAIAGMLTEMTGDQWHYVVGVTHRWDISGHCGSPPSGQAWGYAGNALLSRHGFVEIDGGMQWTNLPLPRNDDVTPACPVTEPRPGTHQRCVLSAQVAVAGASNALVHTTHLEHADPALRAQQVATLVERFGPTRQPAIFAGDLNFEPHDPVHALVEATGWVDAYATALGVAADCPHAGLAGCTFPSAAQPGAEPPARRIDYVFHSAAVEALSIEVCGPGSSPCGAHPLASDHLPVRMTAGLPPA